MPSPPAFATAAGVMFLAGLGVPILAALNGGLGRGLDHPVGATVVTFAVGLLISLIILAIVGVPQWSRIATVTPQNFFGAVFMVFYILTATYFAPRIGVGNAIFFVLLGQLIAAAVIDHLGLFGALRFDMTPRRMLGVAVMALGVWLAKRTV